jgi:arginyl-tRNA synthetase
MLRWDLPHFEHIQFGRMRFPDRAMSTRMGNILKLEEVLDEAVQRAERLIKEHECALEGEGRQELAEMVGVGSLVYVILSQNRKSDLIFTWERSLTFEGNSAPYLQYTHARARSVLRKGAVVHIDPPASLPSLHPREGELLKQLSRFPQILEQARIDGMPHKLTHYLYALCQSFNALYNALPILEAPQELRTLRLALTELTADVLKVGAELLTLRVPDRM